PLTTMQVIVIQNGSGALAGDDCIVHIAGRVLESSDLPDQGRARLEGVLECLEGGAELLRGDPNFMDPVRIGIGRIDVVRNDAAEVVPDQRWSTRGDRRCRRVARANEGSCLTQCATEPSSAEFRLEALGSRLAFVAPGSAQRRKVMRVL